MGFEELLSFDKVLRSVDADSFDIGDADFNFISVLQSSELFE